MVFAEIDDNYTQFSDESVWRKLAFCRRGSERSSQFAVVWFLLKSMVNIIICWTITKFRITEEQGGIAYIILVPFLYHKASKTETTGICHKTP